MSTTQQDLASLISLAMSEHPHLKQQKLRFETAAGHVVLRGVVGSYYQKQLAQEAVRQLDGVDTIENYLEVDWGMPPF
mgnify:CR=1 FL=1